MHRLLVIALSLLLTSPAAALIVDASDEERFERPPKDDPGWAYVGQRGSTSAVYLGNGWVLGVRHGGPGDLVLDGVTYPAVPKSMVQLVKPGAKDTKADLILFRVDPAPDLPELPLREEPLHFGTRVTFIALGQGRGEAIELQGVAGFRWKPPAVKRWGTNRIYAGGIDVTVANTTWITRCFQTDFSPYGTPHETQAAVGDSGGAVFAKGLRGWELAGLLVSIAGGAEQEPRTALYGNTTNAADLGYYRPQILKLIRPDAQAGGN
ncbi:MAG: hypothetical protein JRS35_20915 [Deltaproteobacteria bacterium]|nr:hypothetical protein [Deltaproteobacteria bacterium]